MNLNFLKGYRTVIVGVAFVLFGVAKALGVDLPASDNGTSEVISGLIMLGLRYITDSPVGKQG